MRVLEEEVATLQRTVIRGEDGVGGEMKRAFLFACQTGLRWSDLCALTWGRIRGLQIETTQKKTGEVLYVPLNASAWALINPGDRLPAHSERVFPLIGRSSTDKYIGPWGKAAGIDHLFFHRSRHTFIRLLLDRGADLATAQGLAGHRKIETTARYGQASDKQKRAAVDRL